MRAAVVVFPGSNADREMVHTLSGVCGIPTHVVWHTARELPPATDLVAIPGGFSYGDYLRCGALAKVSPILGAIRAHADRGGFVLGVCNGFQILAEAGLLPGALTRNAHRRFECRDVFVRVECTGPFTPRVGAVWRLPIAHAEGRYQVTPQELEALRKDERIALRYVDGDGNRGGAPVAGPTGLEPNPNGSVDDIAGVYGGALRNVLGLMPHPERMSELALGGDDGRALFDAVLQST